MVFCLHFKKQSDWDSTATYLNACFLWAAGKIPCALYKDLLFWLLQLYQLQILYTQSQIQPDTRADHTQTLQNWFSFTGCEHTIKSSSRWHHFFFFQCFQKEGQKNFMQLHNTDVFNRSYYSREAEIFFCTGFFTCFHSSCVNFSSIIY